MRYAFGLEQVLYMGLLGGSVVMKSPANAGDARDTGLIPGSGGSPRVVNCNRLQYSCLGNTTDRGAWWVHGVAKTQTELSAVQYYAYNDRMQI